MTSCAPAVCETRIPNLWSRGGPCYIRRQPMNFIRPRDRMLIAGLAVAVIVVFSRQVLILIDRARDVERASGLALIPALLILIVVFLFHQQGKRQEAKAQATAAEAVAVAAEVRAEEMERLVTFGQSLGRSLDIEAIRDVVTQQLPKLAGTDEAWAMMRTDRHWQALAGTAREKPQISARSPAAAICSTAFQSSSDTRGNPASIRSTPRSSSRRAISSFWSGSSTTPTVCSPSRSVVS